MTLMNHVLAVCFGLAFCVLATVLAALTCVPGTPLVLRPLTAVGVLLSTPTGVWLLLLGFGFYGPLEVSS